ncbi:MAG: tRNA (adenosine(37)-N6)-dimethylallyltransferase MiaA [Pseudomonadales bacterium]
MTTVDTKPEPTVLLLMGPTASGKTALAMTLAEQRPVHLINMDSAQVYRGFDIGSAKPSATELERYPHALIDIKDPSEPYSAAQFVDDADLQVRKAIEQQRLPVLVGGTMLYARAFCDGLAQLPQAVPEVRQALAARAQREGWPALHAELAAQDPEAAARIHPNNHQRLQRALEVLAITGAPLSAHWQAGTAQSVQQRLGVRPVAVGLVPADRALLHAHIAQRFEAMLAQGLLDEVRALRNRGDLDLSLPAVRAVGYRQAWEHLEAGGEERALVEKGIAATRQLAKRQLTWLRSWPDLTVLEADGLLRAGSLEAANSVLLRLSELVWARLAK